MMKINFRVLFTIVFTSILLPGMAVQTAVFAQGEGPTPAPSQTVLQDPTDTPEPTAIPDVVSFSLTPELDAKTGTPGALVTYQLTVTNTGTVNGTYSVSTNDGTAVSPASFSLEPGGSLGLLAQLVIPASASNGQAYVTTVTVSEAGGQAHQSVLTTTAQVAAPTAFARPLVVVSSYDTGNDEISPGDDFNLNIRLKNNGGGQAANVVATFESTDFLPLQSGGVRSVASIGAGDSVGIQQPLRANSALWGAASGTVVVNLAYTDANGSPYTERFTITINLKQPNYAAWAPTATPTSQPRAQLVVGGYSMDVDPLQPGSIFNLQIQVRNLGSTDAKDVTLVLGGGVAASGGNDGNGGSGQQTGGLSGGSADLSTFAPLGTSNLVYLGTVPVGQVVDAQAQLIVNVSANPGAFPFKLSFVYNDADGERIVDDQVITLLVYNLPKVELGFYRDPGMLFAGQMGPLPIQITNLGRNTAVLGNMRVMAQGADISENVLLIGPLEPGGYFTMDAMAMPYEAGVLELNVSVSYTDDFNQPRTIEQVLTVNVEPAPVFEPMPGDGMEMPGEMPGGFPVVEDESFGQKALRFLKGLLGLGSEKPTNDLPVMPGEFPNGELPEGEIPVKPIPAPKG